MPIVAGILAAVIFFWSAASVVAAPQISITSYPSNLAAGGEFSLSASASGLVASASYSFKVRIGSGSAVMNKGQTKVTSGSADSWLSDTDAWANFPTFTTDPFGIWSGNISARPSSEAYLGMNYIIFRLKRSDQSSYCCDSASVSANVSAAAQQVTTTTTQEETRLEPSIEWQTPTSAIQGESFKTVVGLKDFAANTVYYVKIRGGPDTDHLTKAQTKSGSSYLSDNEAWTMFPTITTNSSGAASADVYGMFSEDREPGNYKILIRVRKKDADNYYESDVKNIVLNESNSIVSNTATVASKTAKNSPKLAGTVLATQSAKPGDTATKASAPIPTGEEAVSVTGGRDWFSLGLILSGLVLSLGAMIFFFYKEEIWRRFYGIIKRHEA